MEGKDQNFVLESKKPKTHETNGSGYQFDAALSDLGFDWESESSRQVGIFMVQTELGRMVVGWRNGGGIAPLGVVTMGKSRPCEGASLGRGGGCLGGGKVASW